MNKNEVEIHQKVVKILSERYSEPVIGNTNLGIYVETMIGEILDSDWELTWQLPGRSNWSSWDIENKVTGKKIEIKQSAACQMWNPETKENIDRYSSFGIKESTGYYGPDNGELDKDWVEFESPKRIADLNIFAWQGVSCEANPDQRDPAQWEFYVVRSECLPRGQKTIGLQFVKDLADATDYKELNSVVRESLV